MTQNLFVADEREDAVANEKRSRRELEPDQQIPLVSLRLIAHSPVILQICGDILWIDEQDPAF